MPRNWSGDLPEHPPCPHCRSEQTERVSAFGSVLANAQYHCNACRTPFEFMKWRPSTDDA